MSDLLKFWIQAENFSRNLLNINKLIKNKTNGAEVSLNLNGSTNIEVESQFKQWQNDAMIIYDK